MKRCESIGKAFAKPFFIYNPVAGKNDPEKVQQAFEEACTKFNWPLDSHATQKDEKLDPVIKDRLQKGCDLVIAGGGDGTVADVASALAGSNIPLAIIPLGTGNLLAKMLEIPHALNKSFDYLAEQAGVVSLDAMQIADSYFFLNASAGFSSALIRDTSRQEKTRFGFLAYIWSGLRLFVGIQPLHFDLAVDGRKHSIRATEVYVSDFALLADGHLVKNLKQETGGEGRMGVFVIKGRTLWDYSVLAFYILIGRPTLSHGMHYFNVDQEVTIRTNKRLTVQADGDVVGKTPVTIKIIPEVVRVLVPQKDA